VQALLAVFLQFHYFEDFFREGGRRVLIIFYQSQPPEWFKQGKKRQNNHPGRNVRLTQAQGKSFLARKTNGLHIVV